MSVTPEISRVREDRYRWTFGGDGPCVSAGYEHNRYMARITDIYARFTPEGECLSVKVTGKRIKKDGSVGMVSASFPWRWEETVVGPVVTRWREQGEATPGDLE